MPACSPGAGPLAQRTACSPPHPPLQGGKLESQAALRLEPPAAGARAVAASSTAERTAVLWSDGTVAVYTVPGDRQPLLPLPTGDSREPVAKRRLAGYRLPAAGKQKGGSGGAASGKKRGAVAEPEAAADGTSMAAVSDKQVALVGWASNSEGEGLMSRPPCCAMHQLRPAAAWELGCRLPARLCCMPATVCACCTLGGPRP